MPYVKPFCKIIIKIVGKIKNTVIFSDAGNAFATYKLDKLAQM